MESFETTSFLLVVRVFVVYLRKYLYHQCAGFSGVVRSYSMSMYIGYIHTNTGDGT
jgi:hypothetical protein